MDTEWIKAAAAQVRTTMRQAINKVDRIGSSGAERPDQQASEDAPGAKTDPKIGKPGADSK